MPTEVAQRYTLIIPTYNRPEDLRRLLGFLAHQQAAFKILVLDSSQPENYERNLATAKRLPLDAEVVRFDPSIPPWEKFWHGGERVKTEFSSFCADDDLILVSSIGPLVDFLAQHPDHSLAHGWYFTFYLSGAFGLTGFAYRSPSIEDADPISRLHALFRNYEAVTYGVYRSTVLKEVLRRVQGVGSMLGRELLGGALTAVAGKTARLPLLYHGRSLGPSATYVDWHPVDFLLTSPRALFEEYSRYREVLLEFYAACGHRMTDPVEVEKLVDLVHLRYLTEYFTPPVIDHLLECIQRGTPRGEVMGGVWPILANKGGAEGALQRSAALRKLRDRFVPWLRGYHVRKVLNPTAYEAIRSTTASGAARTYEVYRAFRSAIVNGALAYSDDWLTAILNGYE